MDTPLRVIPFHGSYCPQFLISDAREGTELHCHTTDNMSSVGNMFIKEPDLGKDQNLYFCICVKSHMKDNEVKVLRFKLG